MRIIDKIKADGVHISFEVFPPKTDAGFESVLKATDGIAELTPSFISVTYGAGGGTSKNTVKIASHIKNDLKIPALAHLTCVSSTKEEVHKVIGQLQKEGIENILALRGDIPQDGQFPLPGQYSHACELIEDIKKMGDFCIGAACYPEGHVEMEHKKDDIRYLKEKVDCGVDFITTQMFFVLKATDGIAELTPSFISVTYGAGGGTSKNTVKIASHIKNDLKIPALAHLTCVSSTKEEVHKVIGQLQKEGIENILALRGDIPQDGQFPLPGQYSHACELIEDIKKMGDFCIGAACYPEGHVEMEHKKDDIRYLKEKVDCGVDFITTQMFFNNDIFYNFLYRIREQGIMIPVLPGIMPITTKKQLARSCALSGTAVPQRFRAIVDYFGDDPAAMKQAGIAYATDQIIDLIANGVRNIHVYSMNKPEVAAAIMQNLSEIVK